MEKQHTQNPSDGTKDSGNIPEIVIPRPDMATNVIPYEIPFHQDNAEKQIEK